MNGLRERALERMRAALAAGALEPLETSCEVIHDAGVPFVVRVLASLARKHAAAARGRSRPDPFLPPDPSLVVADLPPAHVVLLNRFPVIEEHLLLVTRAFEDQQEPLTAADFAALAACLAEIDGLAFYNAGAAAGASEAHKHLQLVPRALGPGRFRPPLEAVLGAAREGRVPALPFRHAFARLPAPGAAALETTCKALIRQAGIEARAPYNLLATRAWMLLVPRAREDWEGISVNALGFAGALLAKDAGEAARLRAAGPMRALAAVALPPLG